MSSSQQENADQDGGTQRKTRAPYIQRACIECKRRKQRCSGHDPCRNCESRAVQCKYGISDTSPIQQDTSTDYLRTVSSQVRSLSDLVESMQAEIRSLKEASQNKGMETVAGGLEDSPNTLESLPSKKRKIPSPMTIAVSPPVAKDPCYQGLTSADYSLKLTSLNLAQLQNPTGSKTSDLDACYDRYGERDKGLSDEAKVSQSIYDRRPEEVSVEVFTEISHSRARELVLSYNTAVGTLHPIVDIKIVLDCVDGLYSQLQVSMDNSKKLSDRYDVIVIRLILAIALLSEHNRNMALVENCYEGVERELNAILCSETVSLRGVTLVLLGAIYQFFSDRVRMAWRLCGTSASLATELGLHRPETLQKAFPRDEERLKAVRVMWSILVLDHGWSAALGLMHHFDDVGLNSAQLITEDCLYLRAMASYCPISTKIVSATSKIRLNPQIYEEEQFQFLNFQIDRWQQTVLDGIVIDPSAGHDILNDNFDSVGTLLYLRANQLRILLLRPLFFSEGTAKPDKAKVSSSLQVAIRTISVLHHLNAATDNYCKQHPFFSHFLTSAVSLILLVVTSTGNSRVSAGESRARASSDICKPLKEALELISTYSSFSTYSAQLHKSVLGILGVLARLNVLSLDLNSGVSQAHRKEQDFHGQVKLHSLEAGYMPESVGFGPLLYTSPPLTSIGTDSQQLDRPADMIPFFQEDHQQMDTFLDGPIWNELDKLLVSHLNSVEPYLNIEGSTVEYDTM